MFQVTGNIKQQMFAGYISSIIRLLHKLRDCHKTFYPLIQTSISGKGIIGTNQITVRSYFRIIGIEFGIFLIPRFIVGTTSFGIYGTKVRIYSHGTGQSIQKLFEIFES